MTSDDGVAPKPTMTEGVLAAFEPVYTLMGSHGWSVADTDSMEVWQVARFVGDERFDPVIRGYRGPLLLDSDDKGSDGKPRKRRFGRGRPGRQTAPRTGAGVPMDSGIVLRGDAAR